MNSEKIDKLIEKSIEEVEKSYNGPYFLKEKKCATSALLDLLRIKKMLKEFEE